MFYGLSPILRVCRWAQAHQLQLECGLSRDSIAHMVSEANIALRYCNPSYGVPGGCAM